ncbi:MAG TPA: hypothetical protein ENN80_00920 [Candidatus Hydrogenedentes bacterium]|mgnify:CR=1 FL=1|nr:hypothetical protein [Candidatus Hydrogenedentota bacterium]
MNRRTTRLLLICASLLSVVCAADGPQFECVCVDEAAHGYATFRSHNQKVVANECGIFMAHIRTRNEEYTAQPWRLLHSVDGGRSFDIVFEATDATNPPALEADAVGNVYLVRPDFVDGNAYLYRFLSDNGFKGPRISTIPGGSAGKFCMYLDGRRQQLYYFAHNNAFHVLGLDGAAKRSVKLPKPGPHAVLQYPQLAMEDGVLHAAWTTQKHDVYLYWDIHFMLSRDGGQTWRTPEGTALEPPIIVDDAGPTPRITLDDEFEAHTWLSNVAVQGGKLHFFYLAQTTPPREHYMRYNVATGERDVHEQPVFKGDAFALQGLDGFFARHRDHAGPLYCLGANDGHLACLISRDNGATWHDYAQSEEAFHIYSLGGCRHVTDDGYIIGSFTNQGGSNLIPGQDSKVYFFRLKAHGEA